MSARRISGLTWLVLALTTAVLVANLPLIVMNGFRNPWNWGTAASGVLVLVPAATFGVIGAALTRQHPRNAVGWICLTCGLAFAFTGLAAQYALYAIEVHPGALPGAATVAWLANWDYLLFVAPLGIYLVLLFPDGRLPSRRWRAVAWLGAVSTLAGGVADAVFPGPLPSQLSIQNPYGIEDAQELIDLVSVLGFFGLVSCMLAAAGSMVGRLRRAVGVERQQLKWFAFAASALAIVFFPIVMISSIGWSGTDLSATPLGLRIAEDVAMVLFAGPPIATGIAITRYRLYDIDVVINRTLVYGALTATLAGTYLAGVLLLQFALSPLTEDSSLAIVASTLGVAALFQPARRSIQAIVDRRFYREKYDAARTLEQFGARLRVEVDLDALADDLLSAVSDTMRPAHTSLWLASSRRSAPRNERRTPIS